MLQLYTILKLFDLVEAVVLNNFWNVTVLQIFFQNPLCHLILSPTLFSDFSVDLFLSDSGYFKYLQLWKIPLAPPNTSGYEKYLWLVQIPLALKNSHNVDFSYFLQLWTLQLFQIPPAMNDSSYFKYLWLWKIPPALDYLRIHFFLVESCLKGLVHSGSSCRSWTYAAATMRNLCW